MVHQCWQHLKPKYYCVSMQQCNKQPPYIRAWLKIVESNIRQQASFLPLRMQQQQQQQQQQLQQQQQQTNVALLDNIWAICKLIKLSSYQQREPRWLSDYKLAFQAGSMPGAGCHIPFIFSLYISIVFIIVRRMAILCIRAVLRARKRTRVAVVEFHVSLYPISVSFLSYMHAKCVNIMTWIAYTMLKGRKTPIAHSSSSY